MSKEEFCPTCLAVPLAMAGVSASAAGEMTDEDKHKQRKKLLLVGGMGFAFTSLLIAVYWFFFKKKCNTCS